MAGMCRRGLRQVRDKVSDSFPMLDTDSDATMYLSGKEAAKFKMEPKNWERRGCWTNNGMS